MAQKALEKLETRFPTFRSGKERTGCLVIVAMVVVIVLATLYQQIRYLGCASSDNHPIYQAIDGQDAAEVTRLLAAGHSANSTQQCYWTDGEDSGVVTDPQADPPLNYAIHQGDADIVAALLAKDANPNQVGADGDSPLEEAIQRGSYEEVGLLLKYHANANWQNPATHLTPLIEAVQLNQVKNVAALLDAGADPNVRDGDGKTALSYAAQDGEARGLLQKHGGHE